MDLFEAVEAGHTETVHQILRRRGGADQVDSLGNSPLHFAASADMARVLLQFGARANVQNDAGQTPMHLCTDERHALLLIECGGLPNVADHSGRTPRDLDAVAAALRVAPGAAFARFVDPTSLPPDYSPRRVPAAFVDALGIVPGALTEEDLAGAGEGVSAQGVAL